MLEGEEGMERGREVGKVRDRGERWSEETGDGEGAEGILKPRPLIIKQRIHDHLFFFIKEQYNFCFKIWA